MIRGPFPHNPLFSRGCLSPLPSFPPLSRRIPGSLCSPVPVLGALRPSYAVPNPRFLIRTRLYAAATSVKCQPTFLWPTYRALRIPPVIFIQPKISSTRYRYSAPKRQLSFVVIAQKSFPPRIAQIRPAQGASLTHGERGGFTLSVFHLCGVKDPSGLFRDTSRDRWLVIPWSIVYSWEDQYGTANLGRGIPVGYSKD